MSENKITAAVRTEFGKGASRRARRDFKVPAVLYGHNTEPRHLLIGSLEFAAILRYSGTNALLTLDIDGEEQLALPKQIDVHPLTRIIEHTDLLVVKKGEKVHVDIAVLVTGEAAPARWSPPTPTSLRSRSRPPTSPKSSSSRSRVSKPAPSSPPPISRCPPVHR